MHILRKNKKKYHKYFISKLFTTAKTIALYCKGVLHGAQLRMITVNNFFRIFDIIIFCFLHAICDLVHAVEAIYGLPLVLTAYGNLF